MELSQKWIGDWIDISTISDAELDELLTRIGHAVEGTETKGDTRILDLEITTNRVDAMSHRGMARELAPALERSVAEVAPLTDVEGLDPVDITIEEGSGCARFAGLLIRGVEVGESPEWLRQRLESLGHRPVNNIVDATNYLMLDLGHPLHAFDYDELEEGRIVVRKGTAGETLETLDGVTRKIDEDTIVVADGKGPAAFGGVMGGASTEISGSTKNVLLECAWFDPPTIRLTARRLNLSTDASYRFERRADPNDIPETIRRCAALITEIAKGTAEGYSDVVAEPQGPLEVELREERLQTLSAGAVDLSTASSILERLGMGVDAKGSKLLVRVPTWRGDITQEIDLIEEVLRFHGYDSIPAELPRLSTGDTRYEKGRELGEALRDRMSAFGLSEVVTYSFQPEELLRKFSAEDPMLVNNALSETVGAMRTTVLAGMAEIAAANWNQGNRDGRIFEVGRTYHRDGDSAAEERPRLAFVMWGNRPSHWNEPKVKVDLFDGTGLLDALAGSFGKEIEWMPSDVVWGRKGATATGSIDGQKITEVALLDNSIRDQLGLKGEVVAGELDTTVLRRTGSVVAREVSKYPGVPMVMALVHDENVSWSDLEKAVSSQNEELLVDVGLWDRYAPEEGGKIKTTLAMWYQSNDRSLSQEEVTRVHDAIAGRLVSALPVELVGEEEK